MIPSAHLSHRSARSWHQRVCVRARSGRLGKGRGGVLGVQPWPQTLRRSQSFCSLLSSSLWMRGCCCSFPPHRSQPQRASLESQWVLFPFRCVCIIITDGVQKPDKNNIYISVIFIYLNIIIYLKYVGIIDYIFQTQIYCALDFSSTAIMFRIVGYFYLITFEKLHWKYKTTDILTRLSCCRLYFGVNTSGSREHACNCVFGA